MPFLAIPGVSDQGVTKLGISARKGSLSGAVVGDGGCARSGAPRRHRPRRAVSARAARKLRGERKNERSRGIAAWCVAVATVDRFLRLPVWEACVERAADGRAQEGARPKGLAR